MQHDRPAASRAATIYDVARVAGVSHQTVSRLLRGFEGIRPQTRARIEEAIAALGYRPNLTARSLATSKSHRIGALVSGLLDVGPSRILDGASHGAREAGYLLDIVRVDPHVPGTVEQALGMLGQHALAGVIAFAPIDPLVAMIEAVGFTVPTHVDAEIDEAASVDEGELPVTRNGLGEAMLVEHLLELGHTRMICVSGPQEWIASRNRVWAYERTLARRGLRSVGTIAGDWSSGSGYAAGQQIPDDGSVTAVVVVNDQMAIGAIRALTERGLRVPEDLSVVGFDDIPEAMYLRPALTTVSMDFDQQGRIAIARLIAEIEGSPHDPTMPEASGLRLCVRESSTAPPRRSRH